MKMLDVAREVTSPAPQSAPSPRLSQFLRQIIDTEALSGVLADREDCPDGRQAEVYRRLYTYCTLTVHCTQHLYKA